MSVETQLKSERVQESLAAESQVLGLKSERVQESLRSMPGWGLLPDGQAISRVREFTEPAHAEAFAAFVARLSLTQRLPVQIDLGFRVIVTVPGETHNQDAGELTEGALALAAAIG